MRLRRPINAALAVAVAALAAAAWLAGPGSGEVPPLTPTQPRSVKALTLHYPRSGTPPLALERRRDGWWLLRPVERRARDGRIVSALRVLDARSRDCYARDAHRPADFGLAQPRLRLEAGPVPVAFGDRAPDGRRYVAAGDRFCLLPDRHYPLLKQGLDGLANLSLLSGRRPKRIATPAAEARRSGNGWRLVRGEGDAAKWAETWRTARAERLALDPPAADRGRVRVATDDGIRAWRIAARQPATILVPAGAAHGLVLAADAPRELLAPPAVEE